MWDISNIPVSKFIGMWDIINIPVAIKVYRNVGHKQYTSFDQSL